MKGFLIEGKEVEKVQDDHSSTSMTIKTGTIDLQNFFKEGLELFDFSITAL